MSHLKLDSTPVGTTYLHLLFFYSMQFTFAVTSYKVEIYFLKIIFSQTNIFCQNYIYTSWEDDGISEFFQYIEGVEFVKHDAPEGCICNCSSFFMCNLFGRVSLSAHLHFVSGCRRRRSPEQARHTVFRVRVSPSRYDLIVCFLFFFFNYTERSRHFDCFEVINGWNSNLRQFFHRRTCPHIIFGRKVFILSFFFALDDSFK